MVNKINLLFITRDFSNALERNSYYLRNELHLHTNLLVWTEPGNIHDILKKIEFTPDFILLNDMKPTYSPKISGLSSLKIPYGSILHDAHWKVEKRKKFIRKNKIKVIFSIYRDAFLERYPEFSKRMFWFPHYVNTAIFKDYKLEKDIDLLLMGNIDSEKYPLRQTIFNTFRDQKGFIYHQHPGYRSFDEAERGSLILGETYARELNRAKIFFTCDSIFKYPVIKYYEALACNTLLLAPASRELLDLGFIPDVHFVAIDETNFVEKADFYLNHHGQRNRIARQGYEMIRQRHSLTIRAAELVSMIQQMVTKGSYSD